MYSNIGERIAFIINDKHLSQKKFSTSIKADATHINKIIKGKSNPSDSLMYLICERYDVNFVWLKNGEGEPYISKTSPKFLDVLNIFNDLDEDLQEFALNQLNQLLQLQNSKSKEGE